ncbi:MULTISPECIES: GNAT family N-acetyltransferase [Legionella]|uniref:N-acetyltransferase domain-containing protein n=1 Tax=Legionella drozanskii LLAP-1 TaxID=1212489 RepID=A0A0W0SRW9_9GAMM|nr:MULTISPECIES: GNAT family N-acetyltransferase [Legionella]KTC86112.1 hypothetical protein Ldro_2437 [Legionella drozanskii LLAP-1]PJE17656.1 MAG: hypothetical protein CK430_02060 [Legionella sp.]
MGEIVLDLIIKEKKIDEQQFHIIANFKGTEVCTAIISLAPERLALQWIETKEEYQHKGVASVILNYLCKKCDSENRDLTIKAVDEEVLNNFYLRWFSKKTDPTNSSPDRVKDKFISFLNDDENPNLLTILHEDLSWDVISGSYTYSSNGF